MKSEPADPYFPFRFLSWIRRGSVSFIFLLGLSLWLSQVSGAEAASRDQSIRYEGPSLPKSDPRIENLVRDAGNAGHKKQHDAEISKLSAALELARDERSRGYLYFLRADAYRRKGDFGRAMQDANEAIRLFPKLSPAFVVRGRLYAEGKQHTKAIADFDRALELNPYSVTAKFERAISYSEVNDSSRAIADNTEVIRRMPQSTAAYHNRGIDYDATGQVDKALADFNKAIQLQPADGESYYGRGRVLEKQKRYHQAAADFVTAMRKGLTDAYVLNTLAWLKATCPDASLRNANEAIRLATKACEKTNWQNAAYLDTLAAAYAEKGAFDQAIKYQTQSLASKSIRAETLQGKEERLRLYKDHKPFRSDADQVMK